ncbi:hypothetical protein BC834DRAFT_901633 [Gloeopeniophorella convolvens]|nr:hypothetical protein BC834DRAFT_901633 [Gloeopeniophorella convolvens]
MATTEEPPFPRYVYKILSEAPPSPLPHDLPLTPLDKQDGFIHLSTGWRAPQTAAMFFDGDTTIWLLRLDTEAARAEQARFKWGDPGCVHMYAEGEARWARMGDGVVVAVREFGKKEGEDWESVLGKAVDEGWLC